MTKKCTIVTINGALHCGKALQFAVDIGVARATARALLRVLEQKSSEIRWRVPSPGWTGMT